MKKFLVLLCAVAAAFSLVACDGNFLDKKLDGESSSSINKEEKNDGEQEEKADNGEKKADNSDKKSDSPKEQTGDIEADLKSLLENQPSGGYNTILLLLEADYDHDEAVKALDSCKADWNERAVQAAKDALTWKAYSYDGLAESLEESYGFSREQAVYGADNCGADWEAEAVRMAKSCVESLNLSYLGLIKQLEYNDFSHETAVKAVDSLEVDWKSEALSEAKDFQTYSDAGVSEKSLFNLLEGILLFTHEEAVYAVENAGIDWDEMAVRKAESYLKHGTVEIKNLQAQLEFDGFTAEQAAYGVKNAKG